MSEARPTVASVDSSDVVDPGDAALNELLGQIADNTQDEQRRERVLGLMLTVPPIAEWPPEAIERWRADCNHIRDLRRELEQRELEQMCDAVSDGEWR
jgi:hypothetical protein